MGDGEKERVIQRQMNDRDKAAEGETVINTESLLRGLKKRVIYVESSKP